MQKAGMVPPVTVFLPESPRGDGCVWGRGHLLTLRITVLTPCKLPETSSVQGQMQRLTMPGEFRSALHLVLVKRLAFGQELVQSPRGGLHKLAWLLCGPD